MLFIPFFHSFLLLQKINAFLEATNMTLLFGLAPLSAENANSLIYHSAHQNYSRLMGFGWGNEQTGKAVASYLFN